MPKLCTIFRKEWKNMEWKKKTAWSTNGADESGFLSQKD